MRMKLILTTSAAIVTAAAVAACGTRQDTAELQEFDADELCTLEQRDRPIGEIYSMSVANDTILLLTTESEVMQYSVLGKYVGSIGHKGRASGEYGMPMKVRSDGDNIYVWDAMGLKFLRYDIAGNYIDEYQYPSALKDFIPYEDEILVYTAGVRQDKLIDIYDTRSRTIVKSLTESLPSQRVFNTMGIYPMGIKNGFLYYMPCCELRLYRYDLRNGGDEECLCEIESASFNVPEINDEDALLSKRSKLSEFYDETSSALMIAPENNGFDILTCEGIYYRENDQRKFDKRYYVFYHIDVKGSVTARKRISYGTFESKSAMNICGNNLYFLKRTLNAAENEENHILFKHAIE